MTPSPVDRVDLILVVQSIENPETHDPETGDPLDPILYSFMGTSLTHSSVPNFKSEESGDLTDFLTDEEVAQLKAILDRWREAEKSRLPSQRI